MDIQFDPKAISASSFLGACVGVATKRLSQDAMYGVGLGIIGLQTLSYLGYINIDWKRIEDDITKAVDQDGDGQLTRKDAQHLVQRFLGAMKQGIPNAAGFSVGFFAGIKFF